MLCFFLRFNFVNVFFLLFRFLIFLSIIYEVLTWFLFCHCPLIIYSEWEILCDHIIIVWWAPSFRSAQAHNEINNEKTPPTTTITTTNGTEKKINKVINNDSGWRKEQFRDICYAREWCLYSKQNIIFTNQLEFAMHWMMSIFSIYIYIYCLYQETVISNAYDPNEICMKHRCEIE